MTHRPCLISDDDILNPPKINIAGRCYRQIPTRQNCFKPDSQIRGRDTSQFQDLEEEECDDGIVERNGGFALEVEAPEALYKFIVGRRAETKHRLEVETRTQISIPKPGVQAPIIIKGHDRADLLSAKTRVELVLETSRWKLPFTHFLSIKLAETEIIDAFNQFKTDVLQEWKGDRGIDESIFQQAAKLHLTLGTLVLLDEREVTQASKLLHDCQEAFITKLLSDGPLNVDVEGLEYMNDDPYNVDVLYAKVSLTDRSDRLQTLADRTVQAFIDGGFMERQYDRVKLHCTVMNSVFRTDVTGMRMEPEKNRSQQKRDDGSEDRMPFDASHLLKKLGGYHFGNLTLNAVHISTRYSTDNDGYYRPAAKISF